MVHAHTRWIIVAVVVLCVGATSAAQGAFGAQLATAVQHAEFSMSADDHDMAVRHLGHVLNCIAGEGGEGFDGSWGHPCGAQGAGLVSDVAGVSNAEAIEAVLRAAHGLALDGVDTASIAAVHASAAGVRALLQVIAERLGED